MSRPFEFIAKVRTIKAADTDWDIVQAIEISWVPGVDVPLAFDRNREYSFRWNGDRWEMYSRNAAKKNPATMQGDD